LRSISAGADGLLTTSSTPTTLLSQIVLSLRSLTHNLRQACGTENSEKIMENGTKYSEWIKAFIFESGNYN